MNILFYLETSQSSKYLLNTFLTHQIFVLVKEGISSGLRWNLCERMPLMVTAPRRN